MFGYWVWPDIDPHEWIWVHIDKRFISDLIWLSESRVIQMNLESKEETMWLVRTQMYVWPDTLNLWHWDMVRRFGESSCQNLAAVLNSLAVPNGCCAVWNGNAVEIGLEISPARSLMILCYPEVSNFFYKYPGSERLTRISRIERKLCELSSSLWGEYSFDVSSQGDRWSSSGRSRSHNLHGEEI